MHTLCIHITSEVVQKSNLEMLNTMEYPNYYPLSRDMEFTGWTIGKSLFERQWVEVAELFLYCSYLDVKKVQYYCSLVTKY